MTLLEPPFLIFKVCPWISNQQPRKSSYTNSHKNRNFYEISIHRIESATLNFENLTTYSKSATSKIPKCQLFSEYDLLFNGGCIFF